MENIVAEMPSRDGLWSTGCLLLAVECKLLDLSCGLLAGYSELCFAYVRL